MRRILCIMIITAVLVYATYKVGYTNGESHGIGVTRQNFSKNVRAAAERDRQMVEDSVNRNKLSYPVKLGKYHYEIRSYGGTGSSLFDVVKSSRVTISMDKFGYSLSKGSPAVTYHISEDGKFFSWEDNESDDGYGDNYHVGRIDDGVVTGRIYYMHFDKIGIKHFKLTPVSPTKPIEG